MPSSESILGLRLTLNRAGRKTTESCLALRRARRATDHDPGRAELIESSHCAGAPGRRYHSRTPRTRRRRPSTTSTASAERLTFAWSPTATTSRGHQRRPDTAPPPEVDRVVEPGLEPATVSAARRSCPITGQFPSKSAPSCAGLAMGHVGVLLRASCGGSGEAGVRARAGVHRRPAPSARRLGPPSPAVPSGVRGHIPPGPTPGPPRPVSRKHAASPGPPRDLLRRIEWLKRDVQNVKAPTEK